MTKVLKKIEYTNRPRVTQSPDLTGQTFHSFLVVKYLGVSKKGSVWQCKCECGNSIELTTGYLREGKLKHCGCKYFNAATTHGLSKTRIYRIWRMMISRCHNSNVPNYNDYGGRGISVCERWRNSFEAFYADMKDGYADSLSIDRKDNDDNYYKENCKWSTRSEQTRNKRNNFWFEIDGVRMIKVDWAKKFGISNGTLNIHLRNGRTFTEIYNHYSSGHYQNKHFV